MLPAFILLSMTVLGLSTLIALFTNSLIIVVNLADKAKGKNLSPSDLIVVTLCISNILFQFIMLVNDFMSFLDGDVYFTDEVYILSTVLLMLPIYSSFWFTVCLSINYYLQIVISTHPFFIRLKLSAAHGESAEITVPRLNTVYLLAINLISCTIPLILIGIANGLIIKALVTHKSDKNSKGEVSARAEGRVRAARTLSGLLFIYVSFYISEILVFVDVFPQSSPGFCTCLMVIYSYSPAQSIVLIFGSSKLKHVSLAFFHCNSKEKTRTPTVLFINS
uniref:Taste receptor type 2 n=1 Tax=Pyxicephalus adspersus TaxID=30357 RepID=A0AAV2ZVX0_PYXAD|nr:TPA: hypothetical protein GDO54_013679 [Pyxicephalus adspersus]